MCDVDDDSIAGALQCSSGLRYLVGGLGQSEQGLLAFKSTTIEDGVVSGRCRLQLF